MDFLSLTFIISGCSENYQKKAQNDYIIFYKTTHEFLKAADPIDKGVLESVKKCAANKGLGDTYQSMESTIYNAKIEWDKINQTLLETEIPATFNKTQCNNAQKVISNYSKAIENDIKAMDMVRDGINAKIKGNFATGDALIEESIHYSNICKNFGYEANQSLKLIRDELGLSEEELQNKLHDFKN